MITALCGGVGGSKLVRGLYRTAPPDSLSVVVNTADDLDFCGLHVSPDVDTVTYTLAGLARRDVGWGIEDDTFHALEALGRLGVPTWFMVGDRDLATDVFRTWCRRNGSTPTEVAGRVAGALGVRARVLPMTDDRVETRLLVEGAWLDFQEYFVRRRHQGYVEKVRYDGVESARPTEAVLEAVREAEIIVLVNSNPVLSIFPILSLPGMREALRTSSAARVAVSPIVGMDAVSGPAGELMRLIGQPASATGVARAYRGLIDGIVVDELDGEQAREIEALGIRTLCTAAVMRDEADRERLARDVVAFARELQ